jgi:voltage-gated sodium channel
MTTLTNFIESTQVRNFIIGVIIFNAIILGLETSSTMMSNFGGLIQALDKTCLVIFVVELALKLIAYRFRFFTNWWNIFDTLVVAVSLVPTGGSLTVLRALRIFRVLRVISTAPRLRRVVEGFVTALPGMASVFLLMAIIFYIGSVISTKLFGASFPEWFGTLGQSAYSLFQIMTLESWSMGIVRPVMEVYPYAWVFFVPFIVVTTFAVVNLLVGLIVNSMQDAHHEDEHAEALAHRDELMLRLDAIEKKLDRLSK